MKEGASREIILVGAGPSGVTAARTLLERGLRVTLLDAGSLLGISNPSRVVPNRDETAKYSFATYISDRTRRQKNVSPKFFTELGSLINARYKQENHISAKNFHLFGALAPGGLSTIWGGVVSPYNETELRSFPFKPSDLAFSYRTVGNRIGISGSQSDLYPEIPNGLRLMPALQLHPTASYIADRYKRKQDKVNRLGVRLGGPLQAVLTEDHRTRFACDYRGRCLTGCGAGSVYNAAFELKEIMRHPNISYFPETIVTGLFRDGHVWHLKTASGNFRAGKVVLAAGTLASTKLCLGALSLRNKPLQLLHNPVVAAGFLVPACMRQNATTNAFAMAQLALQVDMQSTGVDDAHALLYGTNGIYTSDLVEHMPFSTITSLAMLSTIREALVPMTCFFPGSASHSFVEFTGHRLEIEGGVQDSFPLMVKKAKKKITRAMQALGGIFLPGSLTWAPPGADLHYAGTLPMGKMTTDTCGVIGAPGLYVVDGSVLPELPARPCTFTVMAIADYAMRKLEL